MSTVADIFDQSGFDMTMNGELIIGAGTAMIHFGGNDYSSGFLMVVPDGGDQVDELSRPFYNWRILDRYGSTWAAGEGLRDLDGYTHPLDLLLRLVELLRGYESDGAIDTVGELTEMAPGFDWWAVHELQPQLSELAAHLVEAIGHLDE